MLGKPKLKYFSIDELISLINSSTRLLIICPDALSQYILTKLPSINDDNKLKCISLHRNLDNTNIEQYFLNKDNNLILFSSFPSQNLYLSIEKENIIIISWHNSESILEKEGFKLELIHDSFLDNCYSIFFNTEFLTDHNLLALSLVKNPAQLSWYKESQSASENRHASELGFIQNFNFHPILIKAMKRHLNYPKKVVESLLEDQYHFLLQHKNQNATFILDFLYSLKTYRVQINCFELIKQSLDLNETEYSTLVYYFWKDELYRYVDDDSLIYLFCFDFGHVDSDYWVNKYNELRLETENGTRNTLLISLIKLRLQNLTGLYQLDDKWVKNINQIHEATSFNPYLIQEINHTINRLKLNKSLSFPKFKDQPPRDDNLSLIEKMNLDCSQVHSFLQKNWHQWTNFMSRPFTLSACRTEEWIFELIYYSGLWIENSNYRNFMMMKVFHENDKNSLHIARTLAICEIETSWLLAEPVDPFSNDHFFPARGLAIDSFSIVYSQYKNLLKAIISRNSESIEDFIKNFHNTEPHIKKTPFYLYLGSILQLALSLFVNPSAEKRVYLEMKENQQKDAQFSYFVEFPSLIHELSNFTYFTQTKTIRRLLEISREFPSPLRCVLTILLITKYSPPENKDNFSEINSLLSKFHRYPGTSSLRKACRYMYYLNNKKEQPKTSDFTDNNWKAYLIDKNISESRILTAFFIRDRIEENVLAKNNIYLNISDLDYEYEENELPHVIFKEVFKMTPKTYQMNFRLKQTMNSVINSDTSFTEIAYEWCFNDPAHFSREFKRFYGKSPKDYRLEQRSKAQNH